MERGGAGLAGACEQNQIIAKVNLCTSNISAWTSFRFPLPRTPAFFSKFLDALAVDRNFVTAYIPNPYLEPITLLFALADEFRIDYEPNLNQHQILKLLTKFLVDTYADRKRVILCLDEAQALPLETLEALRLLTNLETGKRKLLQVVLFGQPELDVRLNQQSIRQLKQRITFSCTLTSLSFDDVDYYLAHRLSIAGYRGSRLFSIRAVKRLFKLSQGVPRMINILAHKSLMAAFGEGAPTVEIHHVQLAAQDTESTRTMMSKARRLIKYTAALVGALLVSVGALFWTHSL